jgi:hypothetical protein
MIESQNLIGEVVTMRAYVGTPSEGQRFMVCGLYVQGEGKYRMPIAILRQLMDSTTVFTPGVAPVTEHLTALKFA